MDKESLRSLALERLKALSHDEIQSLSFKLTNQLQKFFSCVPDLTAKVGGGYLPLKAEIAPVYQELLNSYPIIFAFPVLLDQQMRFGIPQGSPKGNIWLNGPYQLAEPQWYFVPGLAFDLAGRRLGRGKGFYDRSLERKSGLKIGLAWTEQIFEKVPVEEHDILMDFIITEEYCWNVNQQKKF